jgi:hypothetical protein
MLTAKQLLIKQTAEAFSGRPDMPLLASLDGGEGLIPSPGTPGEG